MITLSPVDMALANKILLDLTQHVIRCLLPVLCTL